MLQKEGEGLNKKTENIVLVAWLISLISMLGSLYFSEIKKFEPCVLCWYQRIGMYPLVLILLIGYIKKDRNVAMYSLVFSAIGLGMSIYHYGIQKLSFLSASAPACGRVPCTGEYVNYLGFVTIPFLAGTGFLLIFICSIMILRGTGEKNA